MRRSRTFALTILLLALAIVLGCQRDPNVKKQRFLESGNRYFDKDEFPAAIIEFSNAVQLDPNFAAAHFKLGEAYLKMQRSQDAFRELQRTIELDPSNRKAALDLGLMFIAGHAYDQAQATADNILHADPNNTDAYLLLSELHRVTGKPDVALQQVRHAIELDPKQPQLYVQLGTIQSGTGDKIGAESSFKKALDLDPRFIPAVQSLASLYEASGRGAEAELQLRHGIEIDPKKIELRKSLAQLYYSQQRESEAEQVMIQAKKDLGRYGDNYRVLGEYYNNIGQADKALAEFAAISKDHPDDLKTSEDYIRLLLSNGRVDEASNLNDAVLRQNPKDAGAQIIQGTILNARGQSDQAIIPLQNALAGAPENAYGHYQLGVALSKTGSIERAVQEWLEAQKLAPEMSEVQLALAQVARQKGDTTLLRKAAEALIHIRPSDPRGYMLRAESEIRSTQAGAAESDLMKAIQIAPQNPSVYTAMGDYLRSLGKNQEAQKYYEQALDRDPSDFPPLAAIVSILMGENENAKALDRVQKQVAITPNSDAAYGLLGGLQVANKDLPGAEASLQKAVSLNRSNLDAVMLLSKVQMARGEGDQALATTYKSIADNPSNGTAYFFAGTMEELRGNAQKAEQMYRKALEIEPDYALAANNLAYLMLQTGENPDAALPLAQLARKKMPDSPSAADTLAWVYFQKGLYGFAANLLQEALQKAPENATYHYHLGMVYQRQNNKAAARKHLQRVLQINPDYPAASEIRRTLNQTNS